MVLASTVEDIDGPTPVLCHPRNDTQRNSLSPVSRLPAEILATIFICNARDSYIDRKSDFCRPTAPDWINVSHVCRYWRDVALNCPTFWTYVPATSQHWTQELLARSQKAPLKIYTKFIPGLDVDYEDRLPQVLSILEQLMNDSQRIEELDFDFDISGEQSWYYRTLSEFLSSPLPSLQHLAISHLGLNLLEVEPQSLPFEANTPALRTLRLRCCSVPWYSLRLSALTTLHLVFVEPPFPELDINIMVEFLAFLRCTPHLVDLYVHWSLPSARSFLFSGECDATPKINLSRLSDVSIDAPLSAVIALLSCVDIPLSTKVELECEPEDGSTLDDYTRLASLLAQRINPCSHPILPVPRFDTLAIDLDEDKTLAFSSSDNDDVSLRVDLHLHEVTFGTVDQILSHICRSIPLTSIRCFYFSRTLPMPSYFWRDILASLPSVRHIRLRGGYMPSIVSMIFHPSDDHPGDEDPIDRGQNKLAPALEELELQNVVLSTARGTDLESLCRAISTRKETRCRLTITESCVRTDQGFEALEFRLE